MEGYCREMLGIDWLTEQVVEELAAEDRLNNTLLVFTADNGTHWGIHRIGQKKLTPYATPVPLYMSWPAMWGHAQYEVSDAVSNIDLAPTFCALAKRCDLGPYPTGQDKPDGKSLLPILKTPSGPGISRVGVLEAAFTGRREWRAVRTSPDSELGNWHYAEWADGSVELYDLDADPWELESQHANPDLNGIKAQLAARLADLWAEGRATSRP
jgi:arylsulfatase A-like enzyme